MFWNKKKDEEETKHNRMNFMSEEEIRMIDDFLTKISQNRGYMEDYYDRWEKEQEAYSGDQPLKDNRPNSRINIINANIEGQVAALTEQNLAVVCRGEGPSDQPFARWGAVGLDWTLRKNRIKRIIERHERRRELFGHGWLKVYWDPDAINGFGLATITATPLNAVFVDTKITDSAYIQEAEYIAEVMPKSKSWAIEHFGEMAASINYGGSDKSPIFTKEKTTDDDGFWYIQLWTKTKGILRLIEFSDDGVLLKDSFKDWDGEQFVDKENPEPFYRINKYGYFLTNLYYEEGKLLGFGDGKLLRPLQDMLNDLYDQIRRAAKPNRIFFAPESNVNLEDLDEDDGPVPCDDPNNTIRVVESGRVNPALFQLVSNIHTEIQKVTRFSELMMGQRASSKTATEANIQQQQGNSATDHKKMILQETLTEVCEYILSLMMEKYVTGKAFRIDEEKDDYTWIDFPQMNEVPYLVPPNDAYTKTFKESNPEAELPQWMQLMDEKNQGMTKSVDLDIEINIGAGMPKNKAFIYQMAESLSGVIIEGKNAISWEEFRKFMKDYLGLPIDDNDQVLAKMQAASQPTQPPVQGAEVPVQGAEVPGMSPDGAPMLSELPNQGGLY